MKKYGSTLKCDRNSGYMNRVRFMHDCFGSSFTLGCKSKRYKLSKNLLSKNNKPVQNQITIRRMRSFSRRGI